MGDFREKIFWQSDKKEILANNQDQDKIQFNETFKRATIFIDEDMYYASSKAK